jgi:hypothetical protein
MYLKPLSTASVTTTSPALELLGEPERPDDVGAEETPAKMPSSAASRRVISSASSSPIVQTSSAASASQWGGTLAGPALHREGALCAPPVIAAEPRARARRTRLVALAFSASETPDDRARRAHALDERGDPLRGTVARSRGRGSRAIPATVYGLLKLIRRVVARVVTRAPRRGLSCGGCPRP